MATLIEQLIANISGTAPSDIITTNIVPVDSSWIDTVKYDPELKALTINLDGGDVYTYYNVSEQLYNRILTTDSPGTFINKVIKNGFHPFSRS